MANNEEYALTEKMIEELTTIANNPGEVIEYSYKLLNNATSGKINVPDPTNPFSYLLEAAAVQAANIHNAHEMHYRYQYPKLATRYEHLYNHMFDEHYIGRFATPGRAKFNIHLRRDEVINALVETDIPGVRKVVIPRGSRIIVQDYTFTLLYNIEIRQLAHGGLHILYQADHKDPVQPLSSNIVDWDYVFINDADGNPVEYIRIKPTLLNIRILNTRDNLYQMAGFTNTYDLKGYYVHCRVYQILPSGKVEEIATTHSDLIYDREKVTAKLTYLESKLKVEIPSLYYNRNKTGGQLFVEIYTTDGDMEQSFMDYSYDNFSYTWGRLDNLLEDERYVVPIEGLSSSIITSASILKGGRLSEGFEKTRDRVINFANYTQTPITPNQLETVLEIEGYDIVKSRDTLTSRTYYASRALPISKTDNFTTPASSSVEMLKVTLDDLVTVKGVRDNGKRITITPETLFKLTETLDDTQGRIVPVKDDEIPNIENLGVDQFLADVNKLNYMYTPFYYVLDTTANDFTMRPYYLDAPYVSNQVFMNNNQTSKLSVSSDQIVILKYKEENEEGFLVRVKTRSIEEYGKQDYRKLFCQLAIQPVGDKDFAYIDGTLLGATTDPDTEIKDYVWEFKLRTNWDITENHGLVVHDMRMFINEFRSQEIPLEGEFHFIYGMMDTIIDGFKPDLVDSMINKKIIDDQYVVGISYDKASYHLGHHLARLWSNAITIRDGIKYERYEEDVPRRYSRDVYDISPDGDLILDADELVVVHHAGDPVLDEEGNPVYFARKGDVKVDKKGMPIIKEGRKIARLIELTMLDGIYYFATDPNDVAYRQLLADTLKDYIINDLESIADRLLENTALYFYAKRTMGLAKTVVDEGGEINQSMRQDFSVTYFLPERTYNDLDIRESLQELAQRVISSELEQVNISTSSLVSKLKAAAGEDVVAVDVGKLGSSHFFTTLTMKDPTSRCSVKRILRQQADRTLKVVEDITVGFVKHEVTRDFN